MIDMLNVGVGVNPAWKQPDINGHVFYVPIYMDYLKKIPVGYQQLTKGRMTPSCVGGVLRWWKIEN